MAKLVWDKVGERYYETGVQNGVLYPMVEGAYPKGVAWNGIISISESPSGAEPEPLYADNIKYLNMMSNEEFSATIEAYTYPVEFEKCDGSADLTPGVSVGQQTRTQFGLCYRTSVGNDTEGDAHGYKLHFIYGCLAAPTEKGYSTINDSPEAITFSWEISTTPVSVTGFKPTSVVVVDSTKVSPEKMTALEAVIYGGESEARLPLPDEIKTIITSAGA